MVARRLVLAKSELLKHLFKNLSRSAFCCSIVVLGESVFEAADNDCYAVTDGSGVRLSQSLGRCHGRVCGMRFRSIPRKGRCQNSE